MRATPGDRASDRIRRVSDETRGPLLLLQLTATHRERTGARSIGSRLLQSLGSPRSLPLSLKIETRLCRWDEEAAPPDGCLRHPGRTLRCKEGAAMKKHTSPLTIGVDVSDKESQFCFLDANGDIVREGKYRTDQLGVRKALAKVPPSRIVLEAGVHSPWMSELLGELGHEVIVADPRRLRLISGS